MCFICPRKFRPYKQQICPACNGSKIQINKEGLKVLCPACGGTGKIVAQEPLPGTPYPDLPRPMPRTTQVMLYGLRPDDITGLPTKWEGGNSGKL